MFKKNLSGELNNIRPTIFNKKYLRLIDKYKNNEIETKQYLEKILSENKEYEHALKSLNSKISEEVAKVKRLELELATKDNEAKKMIFNFAGEIIDKFTTYFSTEDCMRCLIDKNGIMVKYYPSSTVNLNLTDKPIRENSPTKLKTLGEGIPTISKIPAGAYGEGTPAFVFFAYPIIYKGEIIGATGITIDMTNNELIPQIVSGIEELRAASEEIINSVEEINVRLLKIETTIDKFQEKSDGFIKDMTNLKFIKETVEGVADNINLMALNAAIEAARAGDAGRGFAVIAENISKINDSTVSESKHIGEIIQKLNKGVEDIKMAFASLRKEQGEMFKYNEGLSAMYEELNAQIEHMTSLVNKVNIGQEIAEKN